MSSIIARPFSDIARSPSYSPRSLSTLVHFAPAEQTTINCKHLGCDYRFRLPRYVARLASCIDACSLSSMFPSLLVRHRRANPLSRGIISPVYTTAGVYVHKDAFSFYPLRIETCTTPRVTPYHTMPSRRVASPRSARFYTKFYIRQEVALCNRPTWSCRLCSHRIRARSNFAAS